MTEKNKILDYINSNFNIDVTTYRLIDNIYDYLDNHNLSSFHIMHNGKRLLIGSGFIFDFIDILNDSDIDITLEELLNNNLLNIGSILG